MIYYNKQKKKNTKPNLIKETKFSIVSLGINSNCLKTNKIEFWFAFFKLKR